MTAAPAGAVIDNAAVIAHWVAQSPRMAVCRLEYGTGQF